MIKVEIISDFACPWCYLGRKNLGKAISKLGEGIAVEIRWRPFQLSPELPLEGIDYRDYLVNKLGSESKLESAWKHLTRLGESAGINYHFEKITKAFNTLQLHSIHQLEKDPFRQDELALRIFRAHFEDGLDFSDLEQTYSLLKDQFENRVTFEASWSNEMTANEVRQEIHYYRQNRISGVPLFIFQEKYSVGGAQPPEVFLEVLESILKEG